MLRKYIAVDYILLLVFHVTLNGHNTLLKKKKTMGITRYSDRASRKHHSNVLCFVKALEFHGEINKSQFDACSFTRLFT